MERVLARTLETQPQAATHWSTHSLAQSTGLSQSSISRIWLPFSLQPHRSQAFKLSRYPLFIDKVRDIVSLYLNPLDRALVLCVDEKSQIQALDRTAPLLPMRPGQIERRSHDYKRHGTTSLFAAFDVASGHMLSQLHHRHRSLEFRRFLDTIEHNVPAELDVHLILDNYGTHKTQRIRRWLAKRPRFHLHFTPTSASSLNLVKRSFAELTEKQIRRGVPPQHTRVGTRYSRLHRPPQPTELDRLSTLDGECKCSFASNPAPVPFPYDLQSLACATQRPRKPE